MLRRLLQEPPLGAEAGVREHSVDAAERVERRLRQRLVVLPLGDIAAQADRALRSPELLGEVVEPILAAGAEHQPVAGLRGAPGGGGTDPARGTGDEKNRVLSHGRRLY